MELLGALVLAATGGAQIAETVSCRFPATADGARPVALSIRAEGEPHGSGRFDAEINVDHRTLAATGQPITTTPERDVMIRGKTGGDVFYTVGLRDTGAAALNVFWARAHPARQATWIGQCTGHHGLFETWVKS